MGHSIETLEVLDGGLVIWELVSGMLAVFRKFETGVFRDGSLAGLIYAHD